MNICQIFYAFFTHKTVFLFYTRFPQATAHINMSVCPEYDALFFKQRALTAPAWGGAPFFVDDAVTGQQLCPRRISQRTAHHPRMARPASPCSDMPIGGHSAIGNLADDVQHIVTKRPRLFWRHLVREVLQGAISIAAL